MFLLFFTLSIPSMKTNAAALAACAFVDFAQIFSYFLQILAIESYGYFL